MLSWARVILNVWLELLFTRVSGVGLQTFFCLDSQMSSFHTNNIKITVWIWLWFWAFASVRFSMCTDLDSDICEADWEHWQSSDCGLLTGRSLISTSSSVLTIYATWVQGVMHFSDKFLMRWREIKKLIWIKNKAAPHRAAGSLLKVNCRLNDVERCVSFAGTLTVEQIYQDRDQFAKLVRDVAAPDVGRMGIEILSFTIKVS